MDQAQASKDAEDEQARVRSRLQSAHAGSQHNTADSGTGRGRSHMTQRMPPPQHPLPRASGHPPRPFVGSNNRGGAVSTGSTSGEGGMGALLGVASQLRPPRVSLAAKFRIRVLFILLARSP